MKIKFIAVAAFAALTIVSCTKDADTTPATTTETKTAGFEDVAISANSYYNGDSSKTNFVSTGVTFENTLTKNSWGDSWKGFSVSNIVNVTSADFTNQYAAYFGKGANNTTNYAISGNNSKITLPDGVQIKELYVSNSTYAALSMKNGDSFAKKFGTIVKDSLNNIIDDGQDWFLLRIKISDANKVEIKTVDFYLADFRNGKTTIISDWNLIDLSTSKDAKYLEFSLTSSDVGQWGMNTPAYFAIDEISYTK